MIYEKEETTCDGDPLDGKESGWTIKEVIMPKIKLINPSKKELLDNFLFLQRFLYNFF